ncbi:MAG TPA: iron-sulfur cluster assembly protein [Planctomycetaceae bacterium]|nr:iron-sulfur cluster assembly protein [Planctomycetaceae bacterium]
MEHVADLNELPAGGRKSIFIDDVPALLLRIGDQYFAVEDVCSHDSQPLTDGPVTEFEIGCPRHGARFDVRTGKPTRMPATEAISVYGVEVRADGIYAGPAEAAAAVNSSNAVPATTAAPKIDAPTTPASSAVAAVAGNDAVELEDTEIIEALRQVIDPELMINIVDLGLIYAINHGDRKVQIDMTLTSPACPAGPQLVQQSKMVLERIPGVTEAQIKLVMSPPWTPDRMTDEARDQLGIF